MRVIGQPRGNMLLVGIGGSGRQSLARLASSICEYTTFQIEVTKHYRKQEFREGRREGSHGPGKWRGEAGGEGGQAPGGVLCLGRRLGAAPHLTEGEQGVGW